MTHYMNLCSEPFNSIKNKEKIYELRLLDPKRQKVKVGDTITFTNLDNKETLSVKVVDLHKFSSFEELYNTLPLDKCGYNVSNINNATPKDMEKYYSKEKQSQYGVVGIEISLLENNNVF